jgi:hypothetical protein
MCEGEWEVFLRLEMEFKSCSCVGREVGVSIYRWGFKTSHWADFAMADQLNHPRGWLNQPGLTISLCGGQISPESTRRQEGLARGLGPVTSQGHPFVGQARATGRMGRPEKLTDSSPSNPSTRVLSTATTLLSRAWCP